ncbi:centrosomal protein kizuna isoform X2 [Tachyglossus aculeatus]|uniref:centrosomal protein kizuna isoform X2 n=1 Tax=Tachyglossus aculeatus TaxID=9261 RepID=UPI0018F5EE44|nr:centrosomal protein kizuna isoform X2 [Tachyglossus aculeatus]
MAGAPDPSSPPAPALPGRHYRERLGQLQRGLRASEKKRLDLERKLYEYSQSDAYLAKVKYMKLKKYLDEICEAERRAQVRNQEYLKEFERIENHIRSFTTSTEKLQKLKMECEFQIRRMPLHSKNNTWMKDEPKGNSQEQGLQVVRQAGINTKTAVSRGLYHRDEIFMGRQMSAISSLEDFSTRQKSSQPTKSFSIPDPHSRRQTAQSSNVTDSYVVQTNSDIVCSNKPDKIDGKASLQMGEEMPVTSSISPEEVQTHCLEIESNTNNGKSNFPESKKPAELNSPVQKRLSPENSTTDLKCDSSSGSEGTQGGAPSRACAEVKEVRTERSLPVAPSLMRGVSENEHAEGNHRAWESSLDHRIDANQRPFLNRPEQEEDNFSSSSSSSSSNLTVSVSEDDWAPSDSELQPNLGDDVGGISEELIHVEQEKDALSAKNSNCDLQTLSSQASEKESSGNSPKREVCLSFRGFSHLLQFIEDQVEQANTKHVELYQAAALNTEKLNRLINLCNQTGILKEEDLEACGTVVLHQFQTLLECISAKRLLPEHDLIDRRSTMDEKPVRLEQPPDSVSFRKRLCQHVYTLKKYKVSLQEDVAKMFETLLAAESDDQSPTATALLKKALTEECEDRSSIHGNDSSCSLLSILNDNSGIKQANPTQWLHSLGTKEQEAPSRCEDESKEESLEEKIPITETKAYQLLKLSTLRAGEDQTRGKNPKKKAGDSKLQVPVTTIGLDNGSQTFKTKTSNQIGSEAVFSSGEGSPLSRPESRRGRVTSVKSKAFWGESDDSNSDIEAALRPQTHNTSTDDFGDFYD